MGATNIKSIIIDFGGDNGNFLYFMVADDKCVDFKHGFLYQKDLAIDTTHPKILELLNKQITKKQKRQTKKQREAAREQNIDSSSTDNLVPNQELKVRRTGKHAANKCRRKKEKPVTTEEHITINPSNRRAQCQDPIDGTIVPYNGKKGKPRPTGQIIKIDMADSIAYWKPHLIQTVNNPRRKKSKSRPTEEIITEHSRLN